jgi:hypothetical protein
MEHSLVISSQGLNIWRHAAGGIEHEMMIEAHDKRLRTT